MNPIFYGTVKQGKLVLNRRETFDQHLLSLEGDVQLSIGKRKKLRSNSENKYYWAVVVALLSECTGYNPEEMHDALRMLFLKEKGRGFETIRSTSSLSTVEFEDYLSKIRIWASKELACYVPEPNEVETA